MRREPKKRCTSLAMALFALCVAGNASASEEPEAAPGFEFAFSVAGAWWSDSVQNEVNAIRPAQLTPQAQAEIGGPCSYATPQYCFLNTWFFGPRKVTDSTQPHGWSVQVAARAFAPPLLFGGRPWLELGYRQPIGGRDPRTGDAWLRVEHERSALVTAGVEWTVLEAPIALRVSPYAGLELGWFESELARGLQIPSGTLSRFGRDLDRTDLRTGAVLGIELATPLLAHAGFQLEAFLAGGATYWFGGRRSLGGGEILAFAPFPPFAWPSAQTEPVWGGSARIGLRLRR